MIIKTPTMQRLEARYGRPIEEILTELHHVQRLSLSEMSDRLGISVPAVYKWMRRCHIPVRRVSARERPPANMPQHKSAP
jgi:predicted DNA-binding protein YlxM (UPF0122 family)